MGLLGIVLTSGSVRCEDSIDGEFRTVRYVNYYDGHTVAGDTTGECRSRRETVAVFYKELFVNESHESGFRIIG
jgi:hypothetical protein